MHVLSIEKKIKKYKYFSLYDEHKSSFNIILSYILIAIDFNIILIQFFSNRTKNKHSVLFFVELSWKAKIGNPPWNYGLDLYENGRFFPLRFALHKTIYLTCINKMITKIKEK